MDKKYIYRTALNKFSDFNFWNTFLNFKNSFSECIFEFCVLDFLFWNVCFTFHIHFQNKILTFELYVGFLNFE